MFQGNDLIIVVFSESAIPFDPSTFASQFNHVWIVVQPLRVKREGVAEQYQVSVVTKTGVKPFRPFINNPAVYSHGPEFRDWFLIKCINGTVWRVSRQALNADTPSFLQPRGRPCSPRTFGSRWTRSRVLACGHLTPHASQETRTRGKMLEHWADSFAETSGSTGESKWSFLDKIASSSTSFLMALTGDGEQEK